MNTNEIFTQLENAGFVTTINESHDTVTASLKNRTISKIEIVVALNHEVTYNRMRRTSNGVEIK